MQLLENDQEGLLIQEQGVTAIVYGEKLWEDTAALLAIMREDNLDALIAKSETELDAFGTAHSIIKDLVAGYQPEKPIVLTLEQVMGKL